MPESKPVSWLLGLVGEDNICDLLDDSQLAEIGGEVCRLYDIDEDSRADWWRVTESALKLAKQLKESKTSPWPGCSNVKYPLITEACIQTNARLYPEIMKGDRVVKTKVTGEDADGTKRGRAYRVSRHMNWQLTVEMPEWEKELDQLTMTLPAIGLVYRKSYYSPDKRRNVSELVLPDDCVVGYKVKSLEVARRITHRLWFYPNDIWERQTSGVWRDVPIPPATEEDGGQDPDARHEILEQHNYLDLDGDGYKEPYITTVHKQTRQVMRIVARFEADKVEQINGKVKRITPTHYFTPFHFIPNPDGSFYSLGFGQLMEPLNESANTALNQLIDAGTKANLGGGFIGRGARIRGGVLSFTMGEYKPVDVTGQALKDNIVEMPAKEPSAVLFQLLGFLVQAGKEISVPDVLSGDAATMGKDASPNTVMAMIEQGMKVFGSIYKRIYRSLGEEFKKLYELNARHLDPETYFTVQGAAPTPAPAQNPGAAGSPLDPNALYVEPTQQLSIGQGDYRLPDIDVVPVADPTLATDLQRAAQGQVLLSMMAMPGVNPVEIVRAVVEDLPLEDDKKKKILLPNLPDGSTPKPTPAPQMIVAQSKAQEAQVRLMMDSKKFELELAELLAKIEQTKANAVLALAKAGQVADKNTIEQYKAELSALSKDAEQQVTLVKEIMRQHGQANGGGVRGVEGAPHDQKGVGNSQGAAPEGG